MHPNNNNKNNNNKNKQKNATKPALMNKEILDKVKHRKEGSLTLVS